MEMNISSIRPVLGSACSRLMKYRNVVATGLGYKVTAGKKTGQLSIVCSVEKKEPASKLSVFDLLPGSVDGIPTDIVPTGRIRALQAPFDKIRPAPGGSSIGHYAITAGTLGCLVRRNGEVYILSNNHVLANSNDASAGDPVLQPGPYDGGKNPDDLIAELTAFVPIHFNDADSDCPVATAIAGTCNAMAALSGSGSRLKAIRTMTGDNLVDAAIARPLKPEDVSDQILSIGTIADVAEASLGMSIQKSGRTTGCTTGEIQQIDVTVDVQYGGGKVARFRDQLLAGAMSQGGDSGSAVLDDEKKLVGLLFAGSDTTTVVNRIQNVFSTLNLTLS